MPESYMVQFMLGSAQDDGPGGRRLLQEIAEEVLYWTTGTEGRTGSSEFPHYGVWESDELGRYEVSGEADETLEWWEQEWFRPDSHGRKIDWMSQIRLATQGDEVEFRIRVSVRAQRGWITPDYASVRRPNIVPRLVTKFRATYFGDRVDALPLLPISAQRVGHLVHRLKDPSRRLPVVLISVAQGSTEPLVSPQGLADQLAGLAEVALLQDESASWELTQRVGRPLACFWGAMRLYWPGFELGADDPYAHRVWLANRIEEQGPGKVMDRLFNMLCSRMARASGDLPVWKTVRDGIDARAEARTRQRLQELGAQSKLLDIVDDALRDADRRRESAIARADGLDAQLTSAQQIIADLEERLGSAQENLRATQEELGKVQKWAAAEPEETEITSVREAVERAREFPNTEVLDSAMDSACRSQSNKGPDLYQVLRALDRLAVEYRNGLGKGVREWLHEQLPDVPCEYASDISDTTTGQRRGAYTFDGIFMPKHLKFGGGYNTKNLLRVYFEFEFPDGAPQCVIGHVGEHLPV